MAELSVEISARIDKLQKELAKAKGEFKGLENSADKTNSNLGKSSSSSAKGIDKLGKSAISGNSAMTAFSRTIQDAPFGIMGVSNNITNLTEQFGYLKNKTGSSSGALKAMLKDLKGFGGITLAISLVTSALLVFGDKIFKTKDKTKELRDEQEKLTKSLEDYVDGLESVDRANLKGEKSAQKELITLGLLKSRIENTTLSTNERKGAIEELRKKYPDYLKYMSDEKILNGGLATTYDALTTSILKRARATAASNMIIKNSEKLIVLESQLLAKQNEIANQKITLDAKDNAANRRRKSSGLAAEITKLNKLRQEENRLIGQKTNLELNNIDLETNIISTGSGGGGGGGGGFQKVKSLELLKSVKFPTLNLQQFDFLEEKILKFKDNTLGILRTIDFRDAPILTSTLSKFDEDALTLKAKLLEFNAGVGHIIQNSLVNTFAGLGNAIGGALATGGNVLSAIGGSIIQGLSNFLSEMGGMLVKYGTLAVLKGKLDLAILTGGPVAIGAGIAAIAVGVALTAAGAAMGSFASKGQSSGSGNNGGGGVSSNTGTFSPSRTSSGGGSSSSALQNVVFNIEGTKLVGVLSNTLKRNRSLGGSLSII